MKCLQKIKSAFHLSLPNITAITKANRPRSSKAPRAPLPQNVLVKQKQAFHGERLTDLKRL